MRRVDGRVLPAVARAALRAHLDDGGSAFEIPLEIPLGLNEPAACFVTLTRAGRLRGCVGSTRAVEPLVEAVRRAAVGAAVRDPRFPEVQGDELEELTIEVSVLSDLEPLPAADLATLQARLRPGADGVVIRAGGRSATFLPQVWRELPATEDFLAALFHKADLDLTPWPEGLECWRYEVSSWREGPRP